MTQDSLARCSKTESKNKPSTQRVVIKTAEAMDPASPVKPLLFLLRRRPANRSRTTEITRVTRGSRQSGDEHLSLVGLGVLVLFELWD